MTGREDEVLRANGDTVVYLPSGVVKFLHVMA